MQIKIFDNGRIAYWGKESHEELSNLINPVFDEISPIIDSLANKQKILESKRQEYWQTKNAQYEAEYKQEWNDIKKNPFVWLYVLFTKQCPKKREFRYYDVSDIIKNDFTAEEIWVNNWKDSICDLYWELQKFKSSPELFSVVVSKEPIVRAIQWKERKTV